MQNLWLNIYICTKSPIIWLRLFDDVLAILIDFNHVGCSLMRGRINACSAYKRIIEANSETIALVT